MKGNNITPYKYDLISSINTLRNPILTVLINNKRGALDLTGKEIIPIIYDEFLKTNDEVFIIKLDNKYGFADHQKVIVPAIYSEICNIYNWGSPTFDKNGYAEVKRNSEYYFVDKEGYEYKRKSGFLGLKRDGLSLVSGFYPDLESKRKIEFKEQFINK